MSIRDEVVAEIKSGGTGCFTCRFLATLPEKERAEWVTLLADRSFPATVLTRVMQKHKATFGEASVRSHRAHGDR